MSKKAAEKKAGKRGKQAAKSSGEIKLSEHPRAKHQIRLAKGWAGLAGCVLAGYASWHSGAPFFDTLLRSLMWGVAAYMLVWFLAVQVWRHLAIAEVRAAEKAWRERKAEAERVARERMAQAQADMVGSR
ncbi:MAG TPA: hypothetical protein VGO83_09790 [Thermoleophilaceae bacterium]|nr:hypothetical protein [Thermoleophilaceae bacterium]